MGTFYERIKPVIREGVARAENDFTKDNVVPRYFVSAENDAFDPRKGISISSDACIRLCKSV